MTIFTFGDSHSLHPFNKLAYVNRNTIGAVLAFSIGRDRLARLDLRKFPVSDGDIVIFCFGEIDCRCHIHKYVTEENSYQSIIKTIVDSYFEGLREIVAPFKKLQVYVYNVVPPIEVDWEQMRIGRSIPSILMNALRQIVSRMATDFLISMTSIRIPTDILSEVNQIT